MIMLLTAFVLLQAPEIKVEPKPVVTKATQVTASVGELVRMSGAGRWELSPLELNADLVETKTGVAFVASKDGVYALICFVGDKPASWAIVTVGTRVPTPPNPPPPDVNPPVPVVTLETKILELYAKDTSPTKKADATQLSAFYSESIGQKFAMDESTRTGGQLVAKIKVGNVLDASKLTDIRKLIGVEFVKIIPNEFTELTAAKRTEIVTFFKRIEVALDALK